MNEDLEIIRKILSELGYTPTYIQVLLDHIMKELSMSSVDSITPHFIYSVLAFEEGRPRAKEIAEYFEDFKKTGKFETKLQSLLRNSPWNK